MERCKDTGDLVTQGAKGCALRDATPGLKGLWQPGMMPKLQVLAADQIAALPIMGKEAGIHTVLGLYAERTPTAAYLCSNVR